MRICAMQPTRQRIIILVLSLVYPSHYLSRGPLMDIDEKVTEPKSYSVHYSCQLRLRRPGNLATGVVRRSPVP